MRTNTMIVGVGIVVTVAVAMLDRRATRREIEDLRATLKRSDVTRSNGAAPNVSPAWSPLALQAQPEVAPQTLPVDGSSSALHRAVATGARTERSAKAERPASRTESFAPIHDTMEATFVSESTDSSWARDARRTAEGSLAQHLPEGSRITAVECRSTMCRIESNHSQARAADKFANDALGDPERQPWTGAFAIGALAEDGSTGAVTMVTYLMREGNDMPAVEMDAP